MITVDRFLNPFTADFLTAEPTENAEEGKQAPFGAKLQQRSPRLDWLTT